MKRTSPLFLQMWFTVKRQTEAICESVSQAIGKLVGQLFSQLLHHHPIIVIHLPQVVKKIDHFVRRRSFRVRPEVLKVLLGLRMKDATSLDAVIESKLNTRRKLTHTEKLLRKVTEEQKRKKSKKEMRVSVGRFSCGCLWSCVCFKVEIV